jgi:hypothetical protein
MAAEVKGLEGPSVAHHFGLGGPPLGDKLLGIFETALY